MGVGEKALAFAVALIFVAFLVFETGMAVAVSHLKATAPCPACLGTGGGAGF